MGRTADTRMEVWVDEEDYIPNKSNRQIRRSKRHRTKEKFRNLLKNHDFSEIKNMDFDDILEK